VHTAETTSSHLPKKALRRAYALLEQRDYAGAERLCHELLAAEPRHPPALHLLGHSLFRRGRTAEGLDLMRRSVALRPDVAEFHVNLSVALGSLGQHDQALAAFDRAIALQPACVAYHGNRGVLLERMGRIADAVESYRRGLSLPDIDRGVMQNISAT
jgi:Flp pilus assembly protein TadD